ncbi:MAG TPA: oligosaccharide flippase family protein [Prolixibacteraceae bacterium]|nr:oligosaccharide flippase family protein [Prolixibacteraceae bacterium]
MKRKFFTNLILLLTINVLVKPFWLFGIDRTVQNVTGVDNYGIYYSLLALSATLNILLDMGITNYNNRNISRYHHLLPKHLGNIMGVKLMLAALYAIVVLGWGALVGYSQVQFHILSFLILNQFLLQMILYLRSNLQALHFFTTDSLVSVLDRVFMILFCGTLLFTDITGGNFKIEWFVYVQTFSYVLATIIIFMIVLKKAGKIKLRFNLGFTLVFLKKTYPYAILILLMAFYNRFDTVLIERLLPGNAGARQVGLYAHGFRLLDAVSMFGVLFAGMLLPIFSRMIKMRQSIGDMVSFSFSLIVFISLTTAISSYFYSTEIMKWMQYDYVSESAPIFTVLMFGFIPITTTYIFGTLLTANGSIKELNIMAAVGMVLNITLNLIVIPRYEALGAAFVSLSTQTVTAIAQVFIAVRIFKLKIRWDLIFRVLAYVLFVIVAGVMSRMIDIPLVGYVTMLIVSVIGAFLVKLIDLRKLYELLLSRE